MGLDPSVVAFVAMETQEATAACRLAGLQFLTMHALVCGPTASLLQMNPQRYYLQCHHTQVTNAGICCMPWLLLCLHAMGTIAQARGRAKLVAVHVSTG